MQYLNVFYVCVCLFFLDHAIHLACLIVSKALWVDFIEFSNLLCYWVYIMICMLLNYLNQSTEYYVRLYYSHFIVLCIDFTRIFVSILETMVYLMRNIIFRIWQYVYLIDFYKFYIYKTRFRRMIYYIINWWIFIYAALKGYVLGQYLFLCVVCFLLNMKYILHGKLLVLNLWNNLA